MSEPPAGLLEALRRRAGRPRLSGIGSRTLRVQLGIVEPAYGGQVSDCISAASRIFRRVEVGPPARFRPARRTARIGSGVMLRTEIGSCESEGMLRSLGDPLDPASALLVIAEREGQSARAGGRVRSSCSGISRSGGNAIRTLRAIGALKPPRAAPQGCEAYSRTR